MVSVISVIYFSLVGFLRLSVSINPHSSRSVLVFFFSCPFSYLVSHLFGVPLRFPFLHLGLHLLFALRRSLTVYLCPVLWRLRASVSFKTDPAFIPTSAINPRSQIFPSSSFPLSLAVLAAADVQRYRLSADVCCQQWVPRDRK